MTERHDVVIVGGGIVGLATAYRLLEARPGIRLAVIEKETALGPQRVEVRLGLRDEQHSEVREGLSEDDRVIIRKTNSLEQLQKAFSQNN